MKAGYKIGDAVGTRALDGGGDKEFTNDAEQRTKNEGARDASLDKKRKHVTELCFTTPCANRVA